MPKAEPDEIHADLSKPTPFCEEDTTLCPVCKGRHFYITVAEEYIDTTCTDCRTTLRYLRA